jgi:hypothetical protein
MKFKYALPLVLALIVATGVRADDKVESWSGKLAAKAADAKEGVVAVLNVKAGDKVVSVNLWATGEEAKKLTELAAKGAEVTVSGTKVDDTNVKVAKVEVAGAKEAPKAEHK